MQPYERMAEANLNKRWARISPDRSKLASGMLYYPVVEISEVGSDNIDRYLMEPNPPKGPFEPADYEEDKLTQYILRLDVTNDNIFILKSTKNEDNNSDKGQEICVIDWEGNPQDKFIISNEYQLDYITVDEKNKHIYGINYRNDKSYKFDFSHVN